MICVMSVFLEFNSEKKSIKKKFFRFLVELIKNTILNMPAGIGDCQ